MNRDKVTERLTSDDGQSRNEAALKIMDSRPTWGLELLVSAVLNPRNHKNYGTLVYAMSAYDCSGHTDTLVKLMSRNNFEVRNTAADILVEQWVSFQALQREAVLTQIEQVVSQTASTEEADFFMSVRDELIKRTSNQSS